MTSSAGAPTRPITRRALLLGLAAAVAAADSRAEGRPEIRALVADDGTPSRELVEALRRRLPTLSVASIQTKPIRRPNTLTLAIGPAALQAALRDEGDGPLLSLFTSQATFARLLSNAANTKRVSAIYAEASPESQLQLVRSIYERRVTVGVMLSDASSSMEGRLDREARRVDVELRLRRVPAGANVVRELNDLVGADVLLALPDSTVYSASTIPALLDSLFRRGKPMVGFTSSLVGAGALASAVASPDDVAAQVEQLLAEGDPSKLPEPGYPSFWQVTINEQVARSLNVVISESVRSLGVRPPSKAR